MKLLLLAVLCSLLASCSSIGWALIRAEMRIKGGNPQPIYYRYELETETLNPTCKPMKLS